MTDGKVSASSFLKMCECLIKKTGKTVYGGPRMAEQNNVLAAVAYLFNWMSGLVVFLMAKDDKFMKFHGLQSILGTIAFSVVTLVLGGIAAVLSFVLVFAVAALNLGALGAILIFIPYGLLIIYLLGVLALWLWAMYKAFKGEKYHLPIVGGLAEKYV